VVSGVVFGEHPGTPRLPATPEECDPLDALELPVLRALQRPPCVVSFSGGRDSSTVLAVATRVARREGLALPIPVTLRFSDTPETDESAWQELVVSALRLPDWQRRAVVGEELDFVGPLAQNVLRRHGVVWPPNSHVHTPLFEYAKDGTMLTGVDGDGLFGEWRWWRAASVAAGRARPTARDVLRLMHAAAPRTLRRRWARLRDPFGVTWLQPGAYRAAAAAWAAELGDEPVRWDRRVAWYARRRSLAVFSETSRLIAEDFGARVLHPFLDSGFLAALAHRGGRAGFGSRSMLMDAVFGEVLPAAIVTRRTKAEFTRALFGDASRRFVAGFDGRAISGIPRDLVDEAALRREWVQPTPDSRSQTLLQAAWLAALESQVEQGVDCRP